MAFRRIKGEWEWEGSGGCEPRTYRKGLEASTWELDPEEPEPSHWSTRVEVLLYEDNCAAGRDAKGRILRPLVHYGRRAITVTYFIRPLRGFQTCPDFGPTAVTLVIHEPLGQRRLRDGAVYPPQRRFPASQAQQALEP